jgi:hypothetical protein
MSIARILFAVALLPALAVAGPASERGVDTPFGDPVPRTFLERWPRLAAITARRGIDDVLFPGGDVCAVPDAALPGTASSSQVSPDGKTLLVITTVQLDAKLAKLLGIADEPTRKITNVLVFLDGPTGKVRGQILTGLGACVREDSRYTWTADGKRAHIVTRFSHGDLADPTPDETHHALLDLAARKLRFDGTLKDAAFSPGLRHAAGRSWSSGTILYGKTEPYGDELQIDGDTAWGSGDPNGARVWDLRWTSDTRLTFCGSKPTEPAAQLRADLVPDASPTITRLGPCPSGQPPRNPAD